MGAPLRDWTECFIFSRSKHMKHRNSSSEYSELLKKNEKNINKDTHNFYVLPKWSFIVYEIKSEIKKIREQVYMVESLQRDQITRPSFNDDDEYKTQIINIGKSISDNIRMCCEKARRIPSICNSSGIPENGVNSILIKNILFTLISELQSLSSSFGSSQQNYLKCIEEMGKTSIEFGFEINQVNEFINYENEIPIDDFDELKGQNSYSLMEDLDIGTLQRRTVEISSLLRSVEELNNMMLDMSTLVASQGYQIDRVDYHIEQTALQLEGGLEHLTKTKIKMKSEKKLLIISIIGLSIILLVLSIIAFAK